MVAKKKTPHKTQPYGPEKANCYICTETGRTKSENRDHIPELLKVMFNYKNVPKRWFFKMPDEVTYYKITDTWIWTLWWLILCISIIGLCDAQIASKTLFLCVSVRFFLWISGLSKEDQPAQCSWASFNLLRDWMEQ